jgi:ribosomal protein L37E
MFCIECGKENPDTAKFCAACGQPTTTRPRKPAPAVKLQDVSRIAPLPEEVERRRPAKPELWRWIGIGVGVCLVVAGVGYGLMRAGVIPGHHPGNTLAQDAVSWDPFSRDEVAGAIRSFDLKLADEEREAKAQTAAQSRGTAAPTP